MVQNGYDKFYHDGGKLLAHPSPGEEVVISGIAGVFPNSRNIYEMKENLFNKVDMVSLNKKWDCDHFELPSRLGAVLEFDKYDGGFFGVHERQSHSMDLMARIFQEKAMEAIFDAGLHPSELEGTRTGVYVAVSSSEHDRAWYFDNLSPQTFAVSGCERSMIAHRLSYFLKVKGPSVVLDTACSSSCYAVEHAYKAIRLGEVDSAIVGGTHLCLNPLYAKSFSQLGTLSKDGACKTFDVRADGYVRSEAIAVLVLQKAKDSKRIYARVVHAHTNSDGFKEQSIAFPSKYSQMKLINDLYEQCGVDRFSLSFMEAHGTGTPTGDPQECAAFDNVLTNGRKKPLLIGSIKSNIGHTEPASGLCSIIKCILAMEVGSIPPNIHFKTPNDEIAGLVEGRLKVVVDKTPLEEENALMGINNFGIGGANAQVLLRRNPKKKVQPKDNLPRLACVSGRTEEAVRVLLDEIQTNETDVEYIKLMHEVFARTIQNHLYRGYVVVSKFGGIIPKSFASCPEGNKPLYLTFGELDDWYEIGMQLMVLPVFQDIIKRLQGTVSTKSTDISNVFLNGQFSVRDRIPVVGAVIVQIAIVQLLKVLDVKPSGCFGSSFGELVSAYCNDILTLDQTIDCAFIINEAILKDDGLQHTNTSATQGNQNLRESCDDTVSKGGNKCQRKDIIEILLNAFTNESEFLRNDISKTRIVSADSLVNALTTSRCLGIGSVKPNSVILKIGNFRSNDSEEVPVISLFGVKTEDHLTEFLAGLGSLYVSGCNLQVDRLYPQIDFPVGRGTPMISPFIRWNHSRDKFVPQYHLDHIRRTKHGIRRYKIDLADPQWGLIAGHVVDGRLFFPATGYLYMVWETFTAMHSTPLDASRVSIKNCKFIRATTIPAKDVVVFTVSILRGSGKFEVTEGGSTVAAGTISFLPDNEAEIWTDASPDLARPDLWWNQKDVYKEWRLRGYNFSGKFRSIEKYEFDTSRAYAKWQENWFAFIDNMLILKVLQRENRALQVPIFISEMKINAKSHLELIKEASEDPETPSSLLISGDRNTGIITCGGITTSGIITSPIKRKKDLWTPVLESYQFVPNYTELDLYKSVRVNTQIIVENTLVRRFKAVEVIDEFSDDDAEPLTPIIKSALKDELLVYPSVKILSVKPLDVDVEIENKGLETENDCVLVIASRIINRPEILNSAFAALKENGYVISRESRSCDIKSDMYPDIAILTVHRTPFETILLLGAQREERTRHFIEINSSEDFSWLAETQASMSSNLQGGVVLYSEDPTSGILGLVNCLRKESGNRNVVCVFATGDGGKFNPNCDQLKKNMAFNVYKNGQWGTFRHLQLEDSNIMESEHCFVNISARGDLSSLQWTQGPLKYDTTPEPDKELIYVYYSSLNRKDVMTVTGDLNLDTDADPSLGFEFSGRGKRGHRCMGISEKGGAISNLLLTDKSLIYPVPDDWSLEEAATVPVAYTTAIYALIMRGAMKEGESVLIHSGAGGVGQAAIYLALLYGCKVFTTVGNSAKREFLRKTYPQLRDVDIGCSRDETFEQMVLKQTNGKGVDIVLNSLGEGRLVASVRCLAASGRFLEIGQSDLTSNKHLDMLLFSKQASFHGITVDGVCDNKIRSGIRMIFRKLMAVGGIKPLSRTAFRGDEVEQAFRFMATGNHIGKVLIKVRESEEQLKLAPPKLSLKGVARYYCEPQHVYIIVGGLGGMGLELAGWLVLRGARKLVLTSRKGITTGYQRYRVRLWESYGAVVKISTAPVASREGCEQLIEEGSKLGSVVAIFNLAVELEDAIFGNHSPKSFGVPFAAKAVATKHLDDVTRTMCGELRDFVVFSSVACGRGSPGQTNYGMANSVMERICEERNRNGYPALAIQWGQVGGVGIVADMHENTGSEIVGTVPQSIFSCLQVLDTFLTQGNASVVSSMVAAHKQEALSVDNIVDSVINTLGVRDVKQVSFQSTLAELGMNSLIAIEVKLTLQREFGISFSTKDLRSMTLARLKEIQKEKNGTSQVVEKNC